MSKKNTEAMLKIFSNLIKNLTDEQFENLLNGHAVFQYVETDTNPKNEYERIKEKIVQEANNLDDVKKLLENYPKKYLTSLCHYYDINIKSKDTKPLLIQKVAFHFNIFSTKDAEPDRKECPACEYSLIGNKLKEIDNVVEAREYLIKQTTTKANLLKVAKTLNVYINQRQTKQQILMRIVDSVVGAKLRAQGIREK